MLYVVPDLALGCASCILYVECPLSFNQFAASAEPAPGFCGESRTPFYITFDHLIPNPVILRPNLKVPSLQILCSNLPYKRQGPVANLVRQNIALDATRLVLTSVTLCDLNHALTLVDDGRSEAMKLADEMINNSKSYYSIKRPVTLNAS